MKQPYANLFCEDNFFFWGGNGPIDDVKFPPPLFFSDNIYCAQFGETRCVCPRYFECKIHCAVRLPPPSDISSVYPSICGTFLLSAL